MKIGIMRPDGSIIECDSIMDARPTPIARTTVHEGDEIVTISTVFLGYAIHGEWFETMIFRGSHNGEMMRSTTYQMAQVAHDSMIAMVKA
jgi:hypothetical protein